MLKSHKQNGQSNDFKIKSILPDVLPNLPRCLLAVISLVVDKKV